MGEYIFDSQEVIEITVITASRSKVSWVAYHTGNKKFFLGVVDAVNLDECNWNTN